jgi:hypothetical protein
MDADWAGRGFTEPGPDPDADADREAALASMCPDGVQLADYHAYLASSDAALEASCEPEAEAG